MNKKKCLMLLVPILIILGVIGIHKALADGTMRFGAPQNDFIILSNGTHEVGKIDLEPGTYAIYATDGSGTVRVGDTNYELNSDLFEDAKNRTGNAPFSSVLYGILYEESPKISIGSEDTIIVDGDASFKISFVGR